MSLYEMTNQEIDQVIKELSQTVPQDLQGLSMDDLFNLAGTIGSAEADQARLEQSLNLI
jgi:hypothetical protein